MQGFGIPQAFTAETTRCFSGLDHSLGTRTTSAGVSRTRVPLGPYVS